MNIFRKIVPFTATIFLFVGSLVYQADAVSPKVSELGNKHNLSGINTTVTYRATNDPVGNPRGQQICIFCHTPHSANASEQAPLWNRHFSTEVFQKYTGSTTFQIKNISAASYGQPNGSSKLCLSCHDGVSRLGAVYNGAEISMVNDVITGRSSFKLPLIPADQNKMRYGHHPVSFVYNNAVLGSINGPFKSGYTLPTLPVVKLDKQSRMQCTTCHDAHQNQSNDDQCYPSNGACISPNNIKIAPFWVYGAGGVATASDDQQTVCTTCHPMAEWTSFTKPLTPP